MKKAIFAGSFDPIHKGHIQVIQKAASIFDEVIVVVANNTNKKSKDIKIRFEETKKQLKIKNVSIDFFEKGYLANFAHKKNVRYLIRSARDVNDYNYELEMASANNYLFNELETIIIIPNYKDINFKSSLLKLKDKTKK